ncbi:fumarylacetoacetase [Amylibacter marinus]|nr:fumarylacetoacetase [Amylibacter marinus]
MAQQSWVASANGDTDFPIQNLPYGVFDAGNGARMGVAIGDQILDIAAVDHGQDPALFAAPSWNGVMAAGSDVWDGLRARITELLSDAAQRDAVSPHLVPQADAQMLMPIEVSEFTDFYAGRHHAENVGTMFRGPENALPPNWLSMPIGYNGRASSVVVSGTDVTRPWGQLKPPHQDLPHFGKSRRFDLELEMGAIVGQPSSGMVSVEDADQMIFGYVLLNDWSARDIQAWEYQPLGPFQAKATATSISPWIVTRAALEPFRTSTPTRSRALLAHLHEPRPMLYDIDLSVGLTPEGQGESVIARTNYKEMYYSAAQQLCHHTTSGCPMRVGDLLGSGTISGPQKDQRGSLLEISWGGKEPITLDCGTERAFLEDGDRLTLRGAAMGDGFRVGFGECTGKILPATEI